MIATIITLSILWFVGTVLGELVRQNRDKILAALKGRSFLSQPQVPSRPVIVRFSSRYRAEAPAMRAPLRAAA